MEGRKLIIVLFSLSTLFISLTIVTYLFKFGSFSFSDKSDDWVNFANYFSGVLNPILTVLNLFIFAYLSVKLVKIEDDRNNWTLQELTRPFANILFENKKSEIDISIHNLGLGPMIITYLTISDDSGKTFKNFYDLVSHIDPVNDLRFKALNPKIDTFEINSGTGAIGKDQNHYLFKLYFEDDNIYNKDYCDYIRKELNNYTLNISYNDMYNRNIDNMKERLHFSPFQQSGSA